MYPFCCRPFLAFDHWAPSMETHGIWSSICVKAEEKKGISFSRFYWMFFPRVQKEDDRNHVNSTGNTTVGLLKTLMICSTGSPAIPFLAHSDKSSFFGSGLRREGSCSQTLSYNIYNKISLIVLLID